MIMPYYCYIYFNIGILYFLKIILNKRNLFSQQLKEGTFTQE